MNGSKVAYMHNRASVFSTKERMPLLFHNDSVLFSSSYMISNVFQFGPFNLQYLSCMCVFILGVKMMAAEYLSTIVDHILDRM